MTSEKLKWNKQKGKSERIPYPHWTISAGSENSRIVMTLNAKDYGDGLYMEEWWRDDVAEKHILTPNEIHGLIGEILDCMSREKRDKLYAHPMTPHIERMFDRLGADTDPSDTSFRTAKLRVLTRQQLENAYNHLDLYYSNSWDNKVL